MGKSDDVFDAAKKLDGATEAAGRAANKLSNDADFARLKQLRARPLPEIPKERPQLGNNSEIAGSIVDNPEQVADQMKLVGTRKQALEAEAAAEPTPGSKGSDDPPREKPRDSDFDADATREIQVKFPELTTGKIFGLGAAAYVGYMSVVMIGTDGASVEINSVKIEDDPNSDDRFVTISYDSSTVRLSSGVGGTADAFRPSKHDSIDIPMSVGIGGPTYRIIEEPLGDTVKIRVPDSVDIASLMTGVSPPYAEPGTPFTRTWSSNKPRMTIHTSFLNQLTSTMESMMQLMTTVITRLVEIAASTIPQLVRAGTDAAGFVFCSTVPIFCDVTFWMIVVIFIVAIIIFMTMYKKR
jgi:hypothetical protein